MHTITAAKTVEDVTIVLGPEGTGIRITVNNAEGTVYSRLTKYDAGMVGRIERYLRDAGIYRQTSYRNDGEDMLAGGQRAA